MNRHQDPFSLVDYTSSPMSSPIGQKKQASFSNKYYASPGSSSHSSGSYTSRSSSNSSPGRRGMKMAPFRSKRSVVEPRHDHKPRPTSTPYHQQHEKMFDLFEDKAQVEILHSEADDNLAAAMYGNVTKKSKHRKKKSKKPKKGVSGYDFDALIANERPAYYSGTY